MPTSSDIYGKRYVPNPVPTHASQDGTKQGHREGNDFRLETPSPRHSISSPIPPNSVTQKNVTKSNLHKIPTKTKWSMRKKVIVGLLVGLLICGVIVAIVVLSILLAQRSATTTNATNATFLPNQCSNYTVDTDTTRLTTYGATTSACDYVLFTNATWVRFTGGGATQLATSAPQSYRCGTSYTAWLVSPLPSTAGSTALSVVCISWSTNICNWVMTISVTNCNGFYVYLLTSPVSGCNARYCTQ